MTDLERVMWEAWERVGPKLRRDADEVKARLARRRGRMYQRPLRAFCLAVRASDRRINGMRAGIVPMWTRRTQRREEKRYLRKKVTGLESMWPVQRLGGRGLLGWPMEM